MHPKIMARRIEAFTKKQQKMIRNHGYVIHMVARESTHTHGLLENFGHPEIECVLPMDPNILGHLLKDLGERVKAGVCLQDGQQLNDLIQHLPVKLVASPNGLRLILPDPEGKLEKEEMHPDYAAQYEGLAKN